MKVSELIRKLQENGNPDDEVVTLTPIPEDKPSIFLVDIPLDVTVSEGEPGYRKTVIKCKQQK